MMRGEDFENNEFFFGRKSGIKSGCKHMSYGMTHTSWTTKSGIKKILPLNTVL